MSLPRDDGAGARCHHGAGTTGAWQGTKNPTRALVRDLTWATTTTLTPRAASPPALGPVSPRHTTNRHAPAPRRSPWARPALYLRRGQEAIRGPGSDGRTILSQSEDQSRVHPVFIFVRPMSTQVRGLDLDTTEGDSRSDPQIATHAQKRASRQAAGYPKHCIKPPGSMPREHDRRPTVRANVTKGQGISVPQSVSPHSRANYHSANGTEPHTRCGALPDMPPLHPGGSCRGHQCT